MTLYLVASNDAQARATLEYVRGHLGGDHEVRDLDPARAGKLDRESRKLEQRFQHTPEPLIESWRSARWLAQATKPGDVVVMSDHKGLGGIFALDQAAAAPDQRRVLWTVAADSAYLELRLVAKTHEGLPLPVESEVDWEITQYLWSDRVIATSQLAVDELARIGVEAELIGTPSSSPRSGAEVSATSIWVPGAVSRRNQSGDVLRAATSVPGVTLTFSELDSEDGIWSGSAWEATRHSRAVLGDRVSRGSVPERPGAVVLGDPFAPPDPSTIALHAAGVPVLVPRDSVAHLVWPDAPTWGDADELCRLFPGGRAAQAGQGASAPRPDWESRPASPVPDRARAVSVGVPVFRDVRFLDECVGSLLSQTQPPLEVVLIDDGSGSEDVDRALARMANHDPRILTIVAEHRGVCASRNTMLETMNGDAFVFVDSDDVLHPKFIERCAEVLRGRGDVWAVATWTEFFGDYEAIEAKPPFDVRVGMRENPIVSTPVLIDMAVRDKGIRFAEDLAFLYCEDWHFWSQIVASGGRFGLVPEPLARHRVHSASGGYLRTELAHAVGRSRATEPLRVSPS
jgi:GT2 family glycosyltransferase